MFAFCRMPPRARHWLSRRPTGCHPSSDLPLKSVIGSPQAGCPARRSDGARVPDQVTFWPSPIVIEPVMRSPSSRPSNVMSRGIAFPLRRNGEAERAVGELDLGDRPRAAAGSHELSDQGGRTGPFHLEPRRRRLCAALDDEIPSAQQRVGCGARLRESSRVPRGHERQAGGGGADCDASNHDSSSIPLPHTWVHPTISAFRQLEINEPFLYIGSSSGAATRFADASDSSRGVCFCTDGTPELEAI